MHLYLGDAATQTEPHLIIVTSTDVWQLSAELEGLQEWKAKLSDHATQPGTSVTAAIAALPNPPSPQIYAGAPPGWVHQVNRVGLGGRGGRTLPRP